mgnify:CR=1 FL=1
MNRPVAQSLDLLNPSHNSRQHLCFSELRRTRVVVHAHGRTSETHRQSRRCAASLEGASLPTGTLHICPLEHRGLDVGNRQLSIQARLVKLRG